ncbi:MAG: ABC transporter substrate-binding protein [Oscillospiraceae bacterium]|nr:ABC transporter substrate-binding protein [Oscillospiraceae bacterium]
MKRKLVSVLLLLALLLTACGTTPAPEAEGNWQYTFTDSTGSSVHLTKRPETVAVLFSSYAQVWQLAGGTVAVTVGESVERGFAPAEAALVDSGAGKTIDHELLLAAQPDLIIASADIAAQVEACALMTEAGIPTALFRVDTFDDYLSMLKICTDITGNAVAYEIHGSAVAREIDDILTAVKAQDVPAKEILFIRAGSQYSATKAKRAPDNFVCIMLDELGTHNIAADAAVLLDGLSLEEIILRDPDYIFLTTMGSEEAAVSYIGDLFAQEGWRDLRAVQNGDYTFLPKDLFHFKPNARWAEAYSYLAELLYPELNIHG